VCDRKKDMIISGGFNVYPSEIEQLIWGHPAIKDCAVIGIPDEKWGEQVTAVVELKDKNIKPDVQEIITYCKEKLGSVKTPKQILFWDELPRSPVGKVLKKDIRKIFWDKADRKV
jgi:acyl-CoA synthetase (AMP-forming)/AMP-acid ligase II